MATRDSTIATSSLPRVVSSGGRSLARALMTEAAWALGLFALVLALFGATLQDRLYGDGPALLRMVVHTPDGGTNWIHALYVPTARWFVALPLWSTPGVGMSWLSATAGAAFVTATHLVARALGAARFVSFALCLCLAVTPTVWFFSTSIELHSLHGLAVAVCLLVIVLAPWRRPVIAVPFAAVATMPVFLTHQSGALLHGGLLLLASTSWRRVAANLSWTGALARLALPFGLALGLAIVIGRRMTYAAPLDSEHGLMHFLAVNRAGASWSSFFAMWIAPVACLWIPFALLAKERTSRRELGPTCLLFVVPLVAFFTFQGIPERGAYAFGFLPIATAAAAVAVTRLALGRNRVVLLVAALFVAQALIARRSIDAFDDGSWRAHQVARGEHVRSLGSGEILLLSFDHEQQVVELTHPEISEVDFLRPLRAELFKGTRTEDITAQLESTLAPLLPIPGLTVVVDLGYRMHLERAPEIVPLMTALEERIRSFASIESRPLGEHEFWVLRPLP